MDDGQMRTLPDGPTPVIHAVLFVGLNLLDALITRWTIFCGGQEMFWWSASFNSNIMLKVLLSMGFAVILVWLGKERLLHWLNAGMGYVLAWNAINLAAYLIGRHNLL